MAHILARVCYSIGRDGISLSLYVVCSYLFALILSFLLFGWFWCSVLILSFGPQLVVFLLFLMNEFLFYQKRNQKEKRKKKLDGVPK